MDEVNSHTSSTLTADFTDENKAPATPTSARYRIDDEKSGTTIKGWTAITITGTSADIVISRTENDMQDANAPEEVRVVTVDWTYGTGKGSDNEYRYALKNIKGSLKT
jgi:hypothetical protein